MFPSSFQAILDIPPTFFTNICLFSSLISITFQVNPASPNCCPTIYGVCTVPISCELSLTEYSIGVLKTEKIENY